MIYYLLQDRIPLSMLRKSSVMFSFWLELSKQDDALLNHGLHVREYLNNICPNHWIGRRGSIEVAT
ncbi:hypothetical protein J6590_080047 [Homalodisca vitripennis]|nr:hypothetical protein J6590_080047 [Homalodisca vitripennis]